MQGVNNQKIPALRGIHDGVKLENFEPKCEITPSTTYVYYNTY